MEIDSGQMVFLIGHRGAVSYKINSVMLDLSIALTPEDALAGKAEPLMLAIPADYAEKVVASLQQSLARIRQSN